ncbi:phage tail sheath family protein [Piscinibacter defluvii]|uniref:phage tail sheath family protein n=1 Tax=Piscinibacter defluvii TaxID=1796922 RepID=UPI000FDE9411|nr:phage tail sheath subtilisin-like domain-containing protein [Piscinibacter defluvii]
MPEYLAPGVFVEEVSFRAKSIEGVSTTTTGFIGATRFGPVTLDPDILTSLQDFERLYDPFDAGATLDFSDAPDAPNHLWHAVRAFFTEGGKRLYVSRVFHRLDDADIAPMDDTADLDVTTAASDYPDGHARVDPADTPGLRVRARHPGACANLRVAFTLRGSPNVLAQAEDPVDGSTVNTLRAVNDLDLVWVRQASSPPSSSDTGQLCLARRLEAERSWEFEPLDTGSPPSATRFSIDTLQVDPEPGNGDSVRVVTLAISLLTRDGSRELGTWAGLPLDPRHRLGGSPDSVFARFGNHPSSLADARGLPLVLVADPAVAATAFDVVAALFGTDPLAALLPTTDDTRRGITAADKLTAGAISAWFPLDGGNDGLRPDDGDVEGDANPRLGYALGLKQFEDLEDISMVAAPGATWKYTENRNTANAIIGHLIAHAERMRYRVALLDSGDNLPISEIRGMRAKLDSKHAALYYPWVTVLDPVSKRELNLPPSGFVAGICARNDVERGVHKAPANEVVRLAIGFETLLNKGQQEVLNPEGINCFRYFEGRGMRLWGARTISSDPEWKYLNVRRYFAYLERSIDKGTQWAVFEPNGDALWANVRRTIEDFLLNEWQSGALLGDKPERAYFVKCDRTTMTQNDLDNGRLICLIGVAPLKPAEFVIFRIGQWTADRRV